MLAPPLPGTRGSLLAPAGRHGLSKKFELFRHCCRKGGFRVASAFSCSDSATEQVGRPSRCRLVGFGPDETLVGAWQRLERMASLPTQNLAFVRALSRTLLAGAQLSVLIALGAEGADALLPLCHDGGYFARWRAIGPQEVFEPVDALFSGEEGLAALAAALARQSRPLVVDRIPASSPLIPALQHAIRGRGWLSIRGAAATPTIALDEGWRDPEACFSPRRRSDFRRAARKAAEFGTVTCEVLSPEPADFDTLFDEAAAIELRSWKREAGTAMALDRAKEDFFRSYFRSASERGILRLAFLRIDGKAVAMHMAVESQNRYWLFKIGYDEAYGKCSPGTLLMLHTLGWAARRGLQSYELLGHVEPWIAELWTRESRECVRLRTYPFGIRGAASLAADGVAWALARAGRTDAA